MLTSPRFIASLTAFSLGGLMIACSQQPSPTSPSSISVSGGLQPAVNEYWVTLFDETPAPGEPPPPPPPGSTTEPWPPGPPPNALPGIPVPTPPSEDKRVTFKIGPEEPVEHSGTPVPIAGCSNSRYTWYYDQMFHSNTHMPITFTERENFFDGRFVSKNGDTVQLPANGTVILHTRWCSAYPRPHYVQTRFKGRERDGEPVVLSGPWVRLRTPR